MYDVAKLKSISEKLSKLPSMNKTDESGEPKSWNIAYSLFEIVESLEKLNSLILRIDTQELSSEEVSDILCEIESEFSHISYHIKDAAF